jgi:hypothetical protein
MPDKRDALSGMTKEKERRSCLKRVFFNECQCRDGVHPIGLAFNGTAVKVKICADHLC